MAFCTKCGARLPENAAFCTECGAPAEQSGNHPAEQPVPPVQAQPVNTAPVPSAAGNVNGYAQQKKKSSLPYMLLGVAAVLILALVIVLMFGAKNFLKNREEPTIGTSVDNVGAEFAGDWYGWWIIHDPTGAYAEYDGTFSDICARVYDNGDDTGTFVLWDEGNTAEYCLGKVEVGFDNVCMYSISGGFFEEDNIDVNDWIVFPDGDPGTGNFENLICVSGTYTSADNADDGFEYFIFLRPWGMDWEDIKNGDTSDCYYDDMMPGLYEEWYLPQIRAGVTSAPDSFHDD